VKVDTLSFMCIIRINALAVKSAPSKSTSDISVRLNPEVGSARKMCSQDHF
jgi:hypothetical protein